MSARPDPEPRTAAAVRSAPGRQALRPSANRLLGLDGLRRRLRGRDVPRGLPPRRHQLPGRGADDGRALRRARADPKRGRAPAARRAEAGAGAPRPRVARRQDHPPRRGARRLGDGGWRASSRYSAATCGRRRACLGGRRVPITSADPPGRSRCAVRARWRQSGRAT